MSSTHRNSNRFQMLAGLLCGAQMVLCQHLLHCFSMGSPKSLDRLGSEAVVPLRRQACIAASI